MLQRYRARLLGVVRFATVSASNRTDDVPSSPSRLSLCHDQVEPDIARTRQSILGIESSNLFVGHDDTATRAGVVRSAWAVRRRADVVKHRLVSVEAVVRQTRHRSLLTAFRHTIPMTRYTHVMLAIMHSFLLVACVPIACSFSSQCSSKACVELHR